MTSESAFTLFLEEFIPKVSLKSKLLNKAHWLLSTTGSHDAADICSELSVELQLLFSDKALYEKLVEWNSDPSFKELLLKRQLLLLIRSFKQNMIPKELLEQIAKKESELTMTFGNFRATLEGKSLSDNEIRQILSRESDPIRRQKAWEASKELGMVTAPKILELVALRNKAAAHLGYSDYFQMQLQLQAVDSKWLFATFEELAKSSDGAYSAVLEEIKQKRGSSALSPWDFSEPFSQEDPLGGEDLDRLLEGVDIPAATAAFYQRMGLDVKAILERSDNFERPGKDQHAFCINIDRGADVRTLNNVKPTIKWLETMLHELGHAVYELGFDPTLPWLLREPPHMITTEAMALMVGRAPYRQTTLSRLVGDSQEKRPLLEKVDRGLARRQLIFSRWVLVMTSFESELYRDPSQDLNKLWWECVEKYQKIKAPANREGKKDFATKYHIGLAPVYYFSYLLGELFASSMEVGFLKEFGSIDLDNPKVGAFLEKRLFHPGDSMEWDKLIEEVTGKALDPQDWLGQFG